MALWPVASAAVSTEMPTLAVARPRPYSDSGGCLGGGGCGTAGGQGRCPQRTLPRPQQASGAEGSQLLGSG